MKKILFIVFVILSTSASSQTTMDSLKNKKWISRGGDKDLTRTYFFYAFTDSLVCIGFGASPYKNKRKTILNKCFYVPYYLSDNIDKRFDKDKVGKNKNGIYIITEQSLGHPVLEYLKIYEILELNKNVLKYRRVSTDYCSDIICAFVNEGYISNKKIFNIKAKKDTKYYSKEMEKYLDSKKQN